MLHYQLLTACFFFYGIHYTVHPCLWYALNFALFILLIGFIF